MNWISVKDRLPEINTVVIAYGSVDSEKRVEPQYYSKSKYSDEIVFSEPNCGCCSQIYSLRDVTHWMPLPKDPNDKQ